MDDTVILAKLLEYVVEELLDTISMEFAVTES